MLAPESWHSTDAIECAKELRPHARNNRFCHPRKPGISDYKNQGVRSIAGCNLNDSFCRRNAAVKYAMAPAYFVVMGSPVMASEEPQLSLVRARICRANA